MSELEIIQTQSVTENYIYNKSLKLFITVLKKCLLIRIVFTLKEIGHFVSKDLISFNVI